LQDCFVDIVKSLTSDQNLSEDVDSFLNARSTPTFRDGLSETTKEQLLAKKEVLDAAAAPAAQDGAKKGRGRRG